MTLGNFCIVSKRLIALSNELFTTPKAALATLTSPNAVTILPMPSPARSPLLPIPSILAIPLATEPSFSITSITTFPSAILPPFSLSNHHQAAYNNLLASPFV